MENVNSNIKRLVATDQKYHKAPVFIIPKENPKTRRPYDYVSRIPKELQEDVTISLKPKLDRDDNVVDELTVRAYHLQTFDLTNANDALIYEIIKDDPMIAPAKDKVNPDQHRFYVEDKEKEAVIKISKSKLRGKAYAVIAGLSLEQQVNYAIILGKHSKDLSGTQVEGVLYDVAEADPQSLIDVDNDKDLKYKIFLRKCVDKNILHMDNGKYLNGKELVGINEEYAIQWFKDPNNSGIVSQWGRMLSGPTSLYEPKLEQATTPAFTAPASSSNENNDFIGGDNQGGSVEGDTLTEVKNEE